MIPELVTVHTSLLTDLGDAVRAKTGGSEEMTLDEMASAVANIPSGGLPSGYTQIDYLESDGTQYIDTGVVISADSSDRCVQYEATVFYKTVAANYMGATGNFMFGATATNKWYICATNSSFASTTNKWYDISLSMVKGANNGANGTGYTFVVNTGTTTYTLTGSFTSFTTGGTIMLFRYSTNTPISCRIAKFRIVIGAECVRDFIPCIRNSDSVAGMYDIINGQFYTNAGSGTFITP